MTSSHDFSRGLPASTAAGGVSTGLNYPRPEGTVFSMLSHLTLRITGTHGAICDPATFTYVCQRTGDYLQSPNKFWFAPIPPLKDVGFPAHDVKLRSDHYYCLKIDISEIKDLIPCTNGPEKND